VAVVRLHHRGDHGIVMVEPGSRSKDGDLRGNRAVLREHMQFTRDDLALRAFHCAGASGVPGAMSESLSAFM